MLLIVFTFTSLVLWLLSGQSILSFPGLVIGSLEMSNGYESMAYKPTNTVIVPLILAVSIFFLVAIFEINKRKKQGFLVVFALSSLIFFSFKAGYCRADSFHTSIFIKLLFVLALFYSILLFQSKEHKYFKLLFLLCLFQSIFTLNLDILTNKTTTLVGNVEDTFVQIKSNYLSFFNVISGKASLKDPYEKEQEKIRNKYKLPSLKGTVDIYPFHQQLIFAYGLDYRPRPIFQSYAVYTEKLAEINVEHLRSKAPKNILFRIETIDDRYPSLEDSLSWPELRIFTFPCSYGHIRFYFALV
jgi:hypothetical protein